MLPMLTNQTIYDNSSVFVYFRQYFMGVGGFKPSLRDPKIL